MYAPTRRRGESRIFLQPRIEVVEKVCDRIAIISGGKLCRVSSVEDIQKEGLSLEQVYLQYAQNTTKEDAEGERV